MYLSPHNFQSRVAQFLLPLDSPACADCASALKKRRWGCPCRGGGAAPSPAAYENWHLHVRAAYARAALICTTVAAGGGGNPLRSWYLCNHFMEVLVLSREFSAVSLSVGLHGGLQQCGSFWKCLQRACKRAFVSQFTHHIHLWMTVASSEDLHV